MKHAFLLLFAALGTHCLWAQAPPLQWVRSAGGFSQFNKPLCAVDATGYLYTAAKGTNADYGSGVTVLTEGTMLARYDSTGAIVWARVLASVPGAGENVEALATTSTGDVWVAGGFGLATLMIDSFVLTNSGSHSSFMVRFDATGVAQQAISWGGMNNDATFLRDICVDAQDRIYVTGSTDSPTLTIGGVTLTNTAAGAQLYTLAFEADGTALWGNLSASPDGSPRGLCIAVDAAGHVYVAGHANGDVVVDGTTLVLGNADNSMLVKYDNTGALAHMEKLAECMPADLAVDDAGRAYVCGYFETSIVFGSDTLSPDVVDGFVAAFPGDGSCDWVVGVSGEQDTDLCFSVALIADRTQLLVGGIFTFDAWFGPMHVMTGMHPMDGFIMHLDTAGTVNWVKVMDGDGPTLYVQVSLDPWDNLYSYGINQCATTFLGGSVLNGSSSGNNAYLARFGNFTTGLATAVRAAALQLYPNPCNGTFLIDLPSQAHTVLIEDAQGRLLQRVPVRGSQPPTFRIGTPGIYAVSVLSSAGRAVQRVVVE